MNEQEPTGPACQKSTPGSKPASRDICWSDFVELPGITKAIKDNGFRAEDEQSEHISKASHRFLKRHGIGRVYAPGAFPL